MLPVSFDFNGYENNPIVRMCLKTPRHILTEKELLPTIMKLRHSRWAYENKLGSYVGDELRLYLALQSDDFIYIDADCTVENPQQIKMDCCPPNLNNGTFFRANRNTAWVKYYYNLYESRDIGKVVNYNLFKRSPFPIPTQSDIKYRHYFTSFWERFKKRDLSKRHDFYFDTENNVRRIIYKDREEWHYYKGCEWIKEYFTRANYT